MERGAPGFGCSKLAEDHRGEAPLEATQRFAVGLPFGSLAIVVQLPEVLFGAHLDVSNVMQTAVELAIPTGPQANRLVFTA